MGGLRLGDKPRCTISQVKSEEVPGEGGAVSHCPTHPVHVPLNNFHVYQDSIPKLDGSCNPVTGDCLTFVMADSG